ncbi:MAG: hypothetical protein OXG67_09810 [bacterium]|nr:hypothetical protein [bacterium]MCY3888771.1 hypothetical protein [bacterium]
MRSPRESLRSAVLFVLAIALAAGSVAACSSSADTEVVVSGELPDPAQSPTPQGSTPEGAATTPEPVAMPTVTPTEAPDATGLVWTGVDLTDALGADETSTIRLQSVGDGRILAMSFGDRGMNSILVTENGREWTPISVPAGFLPWSVDIAGDRWLIQGWESTIEAPSTQIRFSDDHGVNWTEIVVDLASLDGTAWITDAIVVRELITVVALSDGGPPDVEASLGDDVVWNPSLSHLHIFLSDGGPAELVESFPGWFAGGHGASDGFHLIASDDAGEDYLLYSPDGRIWTRTIVDVEVTAGALNEIWTSDEGYTEYRIERFEGVYGSGQVLTLPEGIGWVPGLAVGPAGIAMVGGPALPFEGSDGDFTMPDIVMERDGYELRYNQPEGGITLWDVENDSAVYVFDTETVQSLNEAPPKGVREVEDEQGYVMVVFDDPETGAELVTFSHEELAAATMEWESAAYSEYDPHKYIIGWSADGTNWQRQTLQEAFGLPERSEDDNSFTEVQVAVGQDFVLAQVQPSEFPGADFGEDSNVGVGDAQPSPLITTPPHRWYIAQVD